MNYELELNQGDSSSVGMLLKDNGVGTDLTGATVTFSMRNEQSVEHNILCTGGGTVAGTYYTIAQGGLTVAFTATHTEFAGTFQAKVTVVKDGSQKTFPSGNNYVTVRIWEAI